MISTYFNHEHFNENNENVNEKKMLLHVVQYRFLFFISFEMVLTLATVMFHAYNMILLYSVFICANP